MCNYFKIHQLVIEKKSFKAFSNFSSGSHLAWWPFCSTQKKGLRKFGRGTPGEHACIIISKSIYWIRRRSPVKVFLFLGLVAILFNGAKQFVQFW